MSAGTYNPEMDNILASLAQRHNGVEDFLGTVFSWFERCTDLFHVMQTKDEKMGFPPGVAEQMVLRQFKKHSELYQKRTGNRVPENLDQKAVR